MHFVYIDDSNDVSVPAYTFSAIAIHEEEWKNVFAEIKHWRKLLKDNDGIHVYTEMHATDFLAGRGKLGTKTVTKYRRAQIFSRVLHRISTLHGINIFNACMSNQMRAFERLINRINRTMQAWGSRAILICDEGQEARYTLLTRKMGAFNPIPSAYGAWPGGSAYKSIPTDRILEDPFFKNSEKSYFVQLADFCAFALLRREHPTPRLKKYGTHKAFEQLRPICVTAANPKDPFGIVRDK